jgi:hypothetical protein
MALGGSEKLNKDAQFVRDTDGRMVVVGINGAAIGGGGGGTTGTPADGFASPGAIPEEMSFLMVWNGTTWDRLVGGPFANAGGGRYSTFPAMFAHLLGAGTATVMRGAVDGDNPDTGRGAIQAASYLWTGASLDRARTPAVFKSFASTALTAGTGITVWTPRPGRSSA